MSSKVLLAAITVVMGLPGVGRATGDVYTSRSAWQAAVVGEGVIRRYDFQPSSGFPTGPAKLGSFDGGRVTLNSEDQEGSLRIFPAGSGNQVLGGRMIEEETLLSSPPFTMSFDPPVLAIGFDLVDMTEAGTELATIAVSGPGRAPTILYLVSDDDGVRGTPTFFGLASAGPVAHVDIYAEDPRCDAPFPCYSPNAIDHMDVVVVPEPAAGLMLMLALGTCRRRRRDGSRCPSA